MVGEQARKRPRPSYTEGKVRDPRIEKMQDRKFQRADFTHLVKKATKPVPDGANASPNHSKVHAKPTQ